MKTNLKNRPSRRKVADEEGDGWYYQYPDCHEYEDWFEAFGKELREKLDIHQSKAYGVCCRSLVREILGESEK